MKAIVASLVLCGFFVAASSSAYGADAKSPQNLDTQKATLSCQQILQPPVQAPASNSQRPFADAPSMAEAVVIFEALQKGDYEVLFQSVVVQLQSQLQHIAGSQQLPSFENTIEALEWAFKDVNQWVALASALLLVQTTPELSEVVTKIFTQYTDLKNKALANPHLFQRVEKLYNEKDFLPLTTEQLRLLENTYTDFKQSGALLDEPDKIKLQQWSKQLVALYPVFNQNLTQALQEFELVVDDPQAVQELPPSALQQARALAEKKGLAGWVITLEPASYGAFMTLSPNRSLREKLWRARKSIGLTAEHDNQLVVKKMGWLRHEMAQLLGYPTHADRVLESRMAQKPAHVHQFLDQMWNELKPRAVKNLNEISQFARERDGLKQLRPWDFHYYARLFQKHSFNWDEQQARPYFELNNLLQGLFDLSQRLYGLKFVEVGPQGINFEEQGLPALSSYHPDVKIYEVINENKQHKAYLYIDLFARGGKLPMGGWALQLLPQHIKNDINVRPLVQMVTVLSPPTQGEDVLLTFTEASILFHEFGHALHNIASQVTYPSLSGFDGLGIDFSEFPSQFIEHWLEHREYLDLFARHHKTKQVMPDELWKSFQKHQKFVALWRWVRLIRIAKLDMAWHTYNSQWVLDPVAYERKICQEYHLLGSVDGIGNLCRFRHLFSDPVDDYSAGVYSYMWAKVFAADASEYHQQLGLLRPDLARLLYDQILSRGASEDPLHLYKNFRGRMADRKALIRAVLDPDAEAAPQTQPSPAQKLPVQQPPVQPSRVQPKK